MHFQRFFRCVKNHLAAVDQASTGQSSWNRQRSNLELANFVNQRLAALEYVSLDD